VAKGEFEKGPPEASVKWGELIFVIEPPFSESVREKCAPVSRRKLRR
jgi:hypothetical protein